jgi:predicted O-linked N-acetylglucosamine transferase (SPINDLY family)
LPPGQHIYLCTQYPGKLHPDFDSILAQILRLDEMGTIAIVSNSHMAVTERLRQRFRAVMPDVAERIVFLPFQYGDDYRHLIRAADVALDPLYYGGMTTTYDALAQGTPVMTLPTQFQRGRYAAALYRKLGLEFGIASDTTQYAQRAVALATDDDLRQSFSRAIVERSDAIFEDHRVVHAYAEVFRRLVAEARSK